MPDQPIDPAHIGEEFQRRTKYFRNRRAPSARPLAPEPPYKEDDPALPRVALPAPETSGGPPLWDIVRTRRSIRDFADRPLEIGELSQLLWACQGVTGRQEDHLFRAAPSAGALYPIETYVVANNIRLLPQGVYHYDMRSHVLVEMKRDDLRIAVARAALGQTLCAEAPAVFVWTAVVPRSAQKYAQRAYRYIYLDAGHIAHALALACVGLGRVRARSPPCSTTK